MRSFCQILSLIVIAVFTPGLAPAQEKGPATVVLKGYRLGGVKFDHARHSAGGATCESCHHASKPEKPSKGPHDKCQGCHTSTVEAPMKTVAQHAFHAASAKGGLCIDCHAKQVAAGKKAPTKCPECHKKENV
jgi:hypothetical protein